MGRIKLNFVKAYVRGLWMLNAHRGAGGDPWLYIDLEHSEHGEELHLGFDGKFSISPERPSDESEIPRLIQALVQANWRGRTP